MGWLVVECVVCVVVDDGCCVVDVGVVGYIFNFGYGVLLESDFVVLVDLVLFVYLL